MSNSSREGNGVVPERFPKQVHELCAKMSAIAYEPPVGFIMAAKLLDQIPSVFNKHLSVELKQVPKKKEGYCGCIESADAQIHGFYVTNVHDLNCYIFRRKTGDPNIYVVFRGTSSLKQMKKDLTFRGGDLRQLLEAHLQRDGEARRLMETLVADQASAEGAIFPGIAQTLFASLDIINHAVTKMASEVPNSQLWVTGHSLGGALATIYGFAVAYAQSKNHEAIGSAPLQRTVNVISLGSPKVGGGKFRTIFDTLIEVDRIRFDRCISKYKGLFGFIDTITQLPPGLAKHLGSKVGNHTGFKNVQKVQCSALIKNLKAEMLPVGEIVGRVHEICNAANGVKLEESKHEVDVDYTKDLDPECPYPSGTICHGHYFGISFMHLPLYVFKRTPAYKLYQIREHTQSGLGFYKKKCVAIKIVSDDVTQGANRNINQAISAPTVGPPCNKKDVKKIVVNKVPKQMTNAEYRQKMHERFGAERRTQTHTGTSDAYLWATLCPIL